MFCSQIFDLSMTEFWVNIFKTADFLKIDVRLQKDFGTVVSKFAPECGVKQGAKLNIDYFVLHQRNFVIILTALFYIPFNAQTG